MLLDILTHTTHDHTHALETVGGVEQSFITLDARAGNLTKVAETIAKPIVSIPPRVDYRVDPPARKACRIAPIGNRDHIVVSRRIHIVRQIMMSRSVGRPEAPHDIAQRRTRLSLHVRAARLHAKIPHDNL